MGPGDSERSGDDAATRALVREVGQRSVERLGEGLTRVIGETSALYRWTLTMLAVLNGGALYLCLGARAAIGAGLFDRVILFFFAGLMAAILAGLVGMAFTLPVAASMRKAITHWTDVAVSGTLSDPALDSAKGVRRMGALWLATTSLIAFAALVLFLFGTALLAQRFGIVRAPAPATPVAARVKALPAETQPAPPVPVHAAASPAADRARIAPPPAPQATPRPTPTPTARATAAAQRATAPASRSAVSKPASSSPRPSASTPSATSRPPVPRATQASPPPAASRETPAPAPSAPPAAPPPAAAPAPVTP